MALTHLADTSVLTRLSAPSVASALGPMLMSGTVARSTMTDLEIGFSARSGEEWDTLNEALDSCVRLPVRERDFDRALTVQRLLAATGQRGRPVPDLLIAATAEAHHLSILHYDRDYELIATVTGQAAEWVVPAGSVN